MWVLAHPTLENEDYVTGVKWENEWILTYGCADKAMVFNDRNTLFNFICTYNVSSDHLVYRMRYEGTVSSFIYA